MKHENYPGKDGPLEISVDSMSLKPASLSTARQRGSTQRRKADSLEEDEDEPIRSPRRRRTNLTAHIPLSERIEGGERRPPARKAAGRFQPRKIQTTSQNSTGEVQPSTVNVIDLSDDTSDEEAECSGDEELWSELDSLRVQKEIKQIELQEIEVKQKLAARKRKKDG